MLRLLLNSSNLTLRTLRPTTRCIRQLSYTSPLRAHPRESRSNTKIPAVTASPLHDATTTAELPNNEITSKVTPSAAQLLEFANLDSEEEPNDGRRSASKMVVGNGADTAPTGRKRQISKEAADAKAATPAKRKRRTKVEMAELRAAGQLTPDKTQSRKMKSNSEASYTKERVEGETPHPLKTATEGELDGSALHESTSEWLYKGYGGSMRRRPLGDTKRIHVVNEELCDDIIERMKPSLTKHIGCDIIDINPGAAVWSSKLHDFLKPRKHILLEPELKLYGPLIQPLLDAPNSTYELHDKSGVVWSHLETILNKNHLPFQEPVKSSDDSRRDQLNNTLLVIANLAYHPKRSYRGFPSLTTLVTHQLLSAIRSHSLFQKYGLVRMLIWMEDGEKLTTLPRHVAWRRKSSIEAELSCANITEIASSTTSKEHKSSESRDMETQLQVARNALAHMDTNNIKVPAGRESILHQNLLALPTNNLSEDERKTQEINRIVGRHAYIKPLEELEARFAAGKFPKRDPAGLKPGYSRRTPAGYVTTTAQATPEYLEMMQYRYRRLSDIKRENFIFDVTSKFAELFKRQREIHADVSEAARSEKTNLRRLRRELDTEVKSYPDQIYGARAKLAIEHHRTFDQEPPVLLYDRRLCEPLRVKAKDFFPQHHMALMDFEPRPLWETLQKDFPANYDIFEYILTTMFASSTQTVESGLTSLWPGAYEWIVEECPSLTDPTKGGDPDLDLISVRCLNMTHLEEILAAWLRWPLKPSRYVLLSRLSSYQSAESEESMGGDAEG